MPLNSVNNGDSGSAARATINAAITQVNTNTINIAALPSTYQPLDNDLTNIAALTPVNNDTLQYIAGAWTDRTPTQVKATLALNNVDNTTDANKPVSTATTTALSGKQDINSQSTLYNRVSLAESVGRVIVAGDQNGLIQFQLGGVAQTLRFPPGLIAFQVGCIVYVANSDTSGSAVNIAAASGAALYVGAKGTSLAAGDTCGVIKISPTEWLRLF